MGRLAIRPVGRLLIPALLALVASLLLGARVAEARSGGIASSAFGADGCNQCHGSGTAPLVALSASATTPIAGEQITLSFDVTSQNASQIAAGFNLRSSQQGTFALGGPDSGSTRTIVGANGWLEATHNMPKDGAGSPLKTTFSVLWTPSAGVSGAVTFTAWGNSVNRASGNQGDLGASTTVVVTYCTPSTSYRDMDADGYGDPGQSSVGCTMPPGYVGNNTDCNDNDATIHPNATEVCNGADDDCEGGTDEGLPPMTFYKDNDADTYGNMASGTKMACSLAQAGAGYVTNNTDCNDAVPTINPGATEVCNGADENCNAMTDDGLPTTTYYRDADSDTHGAAASGMKAACSLAAAGSGYVESNDDCNDADGTIFPGAPEICDNGKDDNCNGVVDTDAANNTTFYRDMDSDGFGSATSGTTMACAPPSGFVASNTDCDDGDGAVHPGATEVCNGKDDDCEGGTDEDLPPLNCGAPTCPTTVPACLNGVPQTCTPVCPPDASPEPAPTPDAAPLAPDTSEPTPDAPASPTVDAAAPEDTDPPVPPPDADLPDRSGMTTSPDGGAPPPDSAPPRQDARRDSALDGIPVGTGGGGCNCHLDTARPTGPLPLAAAASLLLLLLRRRRSRG